MAELTQAWWSKNKAKTLKSTGLGSVLKKLEDATADCKKATRLPVTYKGLTVFDEATEVATKELPEAIDDAIAACSKALHKSTLAILDEYKKLAGKAAAPLVATRADYRKKYDEMEKGVRESCAELTELAATTMDSSRKCLEQAERLSLECDAAQMAIIEDLSDGKQQDAQKRIKLMQTKGLEILAQKTLAVQALAKARSEVKAKFIYQPDTLLPASDNFKRSRDKITGLLDGTQMNIDKIGPLIKQAQASAEEGEQLIKCAGDTSKIYLQAAKRAEEIAIKAADRFSGATRENGGAVDKLNFDFMNAGQQMQKDNNRPAYVNEIKRIAGGIKSIDKQAASIISASESAIKDIEKSEGGFPGFVREDDAAFGKYFETINKARKDLEKTIDEVTKNRAKLKHLAVKLVQAASPK